MCKFQGLTLKNGVDVWTFVRLSAKITAWHRNYSVLVYIWFWVLNLTSCWSYPVSSSIFCAKLCTNMPWGTWKRLVQQINGSSFFFPTVNAYQYLTSLKNCDWSGHILGASASPRSLTKKKAMSPSSTVHGGQHDTKYVTFELLLHAAFVSDENWVFMLELACINSL